MKLLKELMQQHTPENTETFFADIQEKYRESKPLICESLGEVLKLTRFGDNVQSITYDETKECAIVTRILDNNYKQTFEINIACDSGIAICQDIINHLIG